VIYHDKLKIREVLTKQAQLAFVALGWVFDSDGNSEEEWFGSKPINDRSAHQRLKAIGRLRDAISAVEDTCSTVTSRPSPGSISVLLGTAIDQLERLDRDKKNNRNLRFAMDMLLLQPRTA
jgi:hypothetical protein